MLSELLFNVNNSVAWALFFLWNWRRGFWRLLMDKYRFLISTWVGLKQLFYSPQGHCFVWWIQFNVAIRFASVSVNAVYANWFFLGLRGTRSSYSFEYSHMDTALLSIVVKAIAALVGCGWSMNQSQLHVWLKIHSGVHCWRSNLISGASPCANFFVPQKRGVWVYAKTLRQAQDERTFHG